MNTLVCPRPTRTNRAQDASFNKHGANHYARMIEAYAFALRLEDELAAAVIVRQRLDDLMRRCREERRDASYADLLAVRGTT